LFGILAKTYVTDVDYTSPTPNCHHFKTMQFVVYNSHMQDGQDQQQPGWVFKPGDTTNTSVELPAPAPVPAGPLPEPPTPINEPTPPVATPDLDPQDQSPQTDQQEFDPQAAHIEWTASEYIANPKNASWFGLLAVGSFVLAFIVYFISREVISTAVIAALGIIVAVSAARQPHVLNYRIDSRGLYIGKKFYPYSEFKTFSVAQEHAMGFIQLLPLKRFMPPLVIHYAPEDEDNIAGVLAAYLPYEEHKADMVDNLTRRLRF